MSDMKELLDFCKEKNIYLIEDSAQSLVKFIKRQGGSINDISTLSFNANKVIADCRMVVQFAQMIKIRKDYVRD